MASGRPQQWAFALAITGAIGWATVRPRSAQPWRLVWSDEFNGTANSRLNSADWLYDIGTQYPGGPPQWGTREVETMTDSTANVYHDGNGHLAI